MDETPWAEIDEGWRREEERSLPHRESNGCVLREGRPFPCLSFLERHDPTKVGPDATDEEILKSDRQFSKVGLPHRPKRHTIRVPSLPRSGTAIPAGSVQAIRSLRSFVVAMVVI